MMRSFPWSRRLFLALASLAALGSSGSPEGATDVTLLSPGAVIEREVKAGETHRYSIDLREGEYLQGVVDQQGADVEETVLGPDGQVILEMDSFSASDGPEPLAFVAPAAGSYVLTIHANDDAPHSRYVLEVEAVREPTSTDLLRVRTVRATGAGARLSAAGPGEARTALELNRQAIEGWQALGDRRMEMLSEMGMGVIHRAVFGEYREAKLRLERALAAAQEVGDTSNEGQTLFNLGTTDAKLGLFAEAQTHFEQALARHRASGRRDREGYFLMALSRMLIAAGDPQQALDRLHEALEVYQAAGNVGPQVDPKVLARLYMGDAYLDLNEYELALSQYRMVRLALGNGESRDHVTQGARALTGMGSALFGLGDLGGASSALADALRLRQKLGNPALEAETSLRIGDIRREEGDLQASLDLFASALRVFRSQGDPVGEATAQCRLGEIHRRLVAGVAARSAFEAVLALAPGASASLRACAEEGLARLSRDAGSLEAARRHAEAALDAAESFRASVSSHQTRAVNLAAQQSLYDLLIDVRSRQHDREPSAGHAAAALEASERARARSLQELLAEGRIDVREGIEPALLAEERSLRQRLNAEAQAQEEALVAKSSERAEVLGREILDLTTQLAEVQGRIRRASPRYAALTQPQPLGLAEIQRQVLDEDTLLLEYALGEPRSILWVASTEGLASIPLAPRMEIEQAARRVYDRLSEPSRPWQAEVDALSRLVLPMPARTLLNRKRLLVVAPGALQYVPFAVLRFPEAIPPPDDGGSPSGAKAEGAVPLLAQFEVVSAPSASVLATLRREQGKRPPATRTVAVFADPVFDPLDPRVPTSAQRRSASTPSAGSPGTLERALRGFRGGSRGGALARLPFSRQEAAAIVALAPQGNALEATGFAANRDAATSPGLRAYRILHFATHGVLNTRQPDLSGVVLSLFDRQGRPQDGFLRLHDIYNLRLGADLVVLSGCQTGLGKAVQGEGLVGLTRGFMYAGARRVVASLWQVDDESTSELMKRFYRAMLKQRLRPAEALRTAQLEMSRDRRWLAPFYWAGFVLQGEWR